MYRAALEQSAPVGQAYRGPAFHFADELPEVGAAIEITPAHFPLARGEFSWLPDEYGERAPIAEVIADGTIASLCASSVKPLGAAEASLHSAEAARGRGYAAQAVSLWARLVIGTGRRPLYSTEWTNVASRGVAAKLGLIEYGEDLFLT